MKHKAIKEIHTSGMQFVLEPTFTPEQAVAYGIHGAVLLNSIVSSLLCTQEPTKWQKKIYKETIIDDFPHYFEGVCWDAVSIDYLHKLHPYMTPDRIKKEVNKLIKIDVLLSRIKDDQLWVRLNDGAITNRGERCYLK